MKYLNKTVLFLIGVIACHHIEARPIELFPDEMTHAERIANLPEEDFLEDDFLEHLEVLSLDIPYSDPLYTIHSSLCTQKGTNSTPFPYNPYVPVEIWDYVKPYFLPQDHPIRERLDKIFSKKRVMLNPETFKKAGFKRNHVGTHSRIMASTHPNLVGYYVKGFSDLELNILDWKKLVHRIVGARSIQACITNHKYQKHYKVPKKWLYPLPVEPSPPNSTTYHRKNFVLIAEDVRSVGHDKNNKLYKTKMTPEILDQLYVILKEENLWDSIFNFNVPWCKDGKLAFLDTEHHHSENRTVNFSRMKHYFSKDMQVYWQKLIDEGGPQ